jgi:hypothetical protein
MKTFRVLLALYALYLAVRTVNLIRFWAEHHEKFDRLSTRLTFVTIDQILAVLVIIACIGMWSMKRWGVSLFFIAFTVGWLVIPHQLLLLHNAPPKYAVEYWHFFVQLLIYQVLTVAIGFLAVKHYKLMY